MNESRLTRYAEVFGRIGSTPLTNVPTAGGSVFLKRELDNPYGSHYDRVYAELFFHFEAAGLLSPGGRVLETTSGSAGVSFAGIGTTLGFNCTVLMPEGGERARENAITEAGGELELTPAADYISSMPRQIKAYLGRNPEVVFLNHSMGPKRGTINPITLRSLSQIGREIRDEQPSVSIVIAGVGNGSSILGPMLGLPSSVSFAVYEPFEQPVAYLRTNATAYVEAFGIEPGSMPRHRLPGLYHRGIDTPHLERALASGRISSVFLVADSATERSYGEMTGQPLPASVLRWDRVEASGLGRSTRAGLAVATALKERKPHANIAVIGYDGSSRYDE